METRCLMRFKFATLGGPEVLNLTPIEVGEPGSGQVRLRQAGATSGSTILTS